MTNGSAKKTAKALRGASSTKTSAEALADAASVDWMKFDHLAHKAVNANESTSLAALIAYVAYASGKSEFSVERAFADRFRIPNLRCLPSSLFDEAIRYLVEVAPAA